LTKERKFATLNLKLYNCDEKEEYSKKDCIASWGRWKPNESL